MQSMLERGGKIYRTKSLLRMEGYLPVFLPGYWVSRKHVGQCHWMCQWSLSCPTAFERRGSNLQQFLVCSAPPSLGNSSCDILFFSGPHCLMMYQSAKLIPFGCQTNAVLRREPRACSHFPTRRIKRTRSWIGLTNPGRDGRKRRALTAQYGRPTTRLHRTNYLQRQGPRGGRLLKLKYR